MIARYVEVMLMGWKLAFSTNTGSFMAHQLDYISFRKVGRREINFQKTPLFNEWDCKIGKIPVIITL